MNKSLITIFCILSFTSPAAELFVTEEELDTLVKNFMTDMSDEGIEEAQKYLEKEWGSLEGAGFLNVMKMNNNLH